MTSDPSPGTSATCSHQAHPPKVSGVNSPAYLLRLHNLQCGLSGGFPCPPQGPSLSHQQGRPTEMAGHRPCSLVRLLGRLEEVRSGPFAVGSGLRAVRRWRPRCAPRARMKGTTSEGRRGHWRSRGLEGEQLEETPDLSLAPQPLGNP